MLTRVAPVMVATAVWASALVAQATDDGPRPRPALSTARVSGELVAGAYAGYLGFYVGRFAGERLADVLQLEDAGAVRRATVLSVSYAGAAFGTAGAVSAIGAIGDQRGDFGSALLGTGVGFAVAVGVNHLIVPGSTGGSAGARATRRVTDVIEVLLPTIGATIAFNSTRRFER